MSMNPVRARHDMLCVVFLLAGAAVPWLSYRPGNPGIRQHRDYPPYKHLNERAEPVGFNIDIVRVLAHQLGTPIQSRLGDWPEIVRQFEVEESIDIANMFYIAERARRVEYTVPFAVAYDELFVRSEYSGREVDPR